MSLELRGRLSWPCERCEDIINLPTHDPLLVNFQIQDAACVTPQLANMLPLKLPGPVDANIPNHHPLVAAPRSEEARGVKLETQDTAFVPIQRPETLPGFHGPHFDRSVARARHDLRPVPFDAVDCVQVPPQGRPVRLHTCPATLDLLTGAVHRLPVEGEWCDRVD